MSTITIDRAVLEQALEALGLAHSSHGLMLLSDPPQEAWKYNGVDQHLQKSITALREALNAPQQPNIEAALTDALIIGTGVTRIAPENFYAPPQPEPVGWVESPYGKIRANPLWKLDPPPQSVAWSIPLYTSPPRREWEPLSLDQISMAWDRAYRQPLSQAALNFARDIEAALKERNHE